MATATDLRRIALSLAGTIEAPHFDRAAFKVARIYVTLAADGRTANFKFTPDCRSRCTIVHHHAQVSMTSALLALFYAPLCVTM